MENARYEVVEQAGTGGFGIVEKALDLTLDRPVAIKTLDPLFKAGPTAEDVERFHREAKALARLSHPNIPAIYDVDFDPNASTFRIVCEWVEGKNLSRYLQDRGVLSLDEARLFFGEICLALSHAHEQGIVHRDVKPTNVIRSPDGSAATIVDFGIALSIEDMTRLTGDTPIGTPGYMSPEQERGEEVTPASDVFSLGVMLYECLAGSRPPIGGYKSISLHNESIPPGVDTLVQAALEEDPERRPASAKAFADRLEATLKPHSNFTSTLADGSLHEIQLALGAMSPADFELLPPGQRTVLLIRLTDLAAVDEERLRRAVATLVTQLVRLGHGTAVDEYATVLGVAASYGYQKQFSDSWQGDQSVRAALNDAALAANGAAHELLTKTALEIGQLKPLPEQGGWYAHDLRLLLQKLLINPACTAGSSTQLGVALKSLNEATHKSSGSPSTTVA